MYEIKEVSDLDLGFGGRIRELMPAYEEIPEEFRRGSTKWNKLFSTWFFRGLSNAEFKPKKGVDQHKALRHIKAIMASFEPKHEHKEAGCAFLLNEWFEDVKYKDA